METSAVEDEARELAKRFANVNRAEFARTHGVPGGAAMIYQHITGRRPISLEAAMAYARGFNCQLESISRRLATEATLALQITSSNNFEPGPDLRGKVPLISWVQAGQWCEISDQFPPGDAESWRETTARVSQSAFALRIVGDSMEPAIPRGSVVIVDPAIEATNGRVVVVRQHGDSEATIKRLVIEGGVRYLKPDNPRYPIMEMRMDAVICGVAIKVEQDL